MTDQRRPGPLVTDGAVVLLAAACFGTFVAWGPYGVLCDPSRVPPPRHLTAHLAEQGRGLRARAVADQDGAGQA